MHKHIFNPVINIDETYLKSNTISITINKMTIVTFSLTATFLHLIYHLYMDTYSVPGNLYQIFVNKSIPKADRFLYRAYEIALFSEKYYDQIIWNDIIKDIKNQKLRILFKKMILDIIDIFPNTFPNFFINTVCNLDYVEYKWNQFFNYILSENKNDISKSLSNYIDNIQALRKGNNVHIKIGNSFSLIKNSKIHPNEIELYCYISTKKTVNGIELTFLVYDDDFYFSDINNFGTLTSDGVHLILCGTEEYSYNSIYFFPKKINGKIKVLPCNVINNQNIIFDNDLIQTTFSSSETSYTITANFSEKFLKNNHLNSYLYMGLVISDCSSKTHHRKNQLILSEEESEWYNPGYFAKIEF